MELALIPPYAHLDTLQERNYHLMLPQCTKNSAYFDTYAQLCQSVDNFVILDNGIAENQAWPWDSLISLGGAFGVSEIVLPDVMGDMKKTIHEIQAVQDRTPDIFSYMAVVQGQTMNEIQTCIDIYAAMPYVSTLGIPRHLIKTLDNPHVREWIVKWASREYPGEFQIHLLGSAPTRPQEMADMPGDVKALIRGTDTSLPYVQALYGNHLRIASEEGRQENYFELEGWGLQPHLMDENIQQLQEWVNG